MKNWAFGLATLCIAGSASAGTFHGFIDAGGTLSLIDVPGSTYTVPNSINASGVVTGAYQNGSTVLHGFIDAGGTFSTFDPPGSSYTDPTSINASGMVTGSVSLRTGPPVRG
jgi:hypothetical protein